VKYAFVEKNRRQYGVPALCEALQVSRSGYYAARHRGPSERQKRWVDLTARIRTIHQASRESDGAPRVHVELLAQKVPCCRNTVAKLMRRAEILPRAIRRFRVTTDSRRTTASPNLINRDFTSEHPNDLWLSDITYIPTREGWLYLAAVLDAYSRALNSRVNFLRGVYSIEHLLKSVLLSLRCPSNVGTFIAAKASSREQTLRFLLDYLVGAQQQRPLDREAELPTVLWQCYASLLQFRLMGV